MSRLKAHVERLERALLAAEKFFIIDPALARRLRDDYEFYRQDRLEHARLGRRIKRRASAIPCPPSYGSAQRMRDIERLDDAWWKRRPRAFLAHVDT